MVSNLTKQFKLIPQHNQTTLMAKWWMEAMEF